MGRNIRLSTGKSGTTIHFPHNAMSNWRNSVLSETNAVLPRIPRDLASLSCCMSVSVYVFRSTFSSRFGESATFCTYSKLRSDLDDLVGLKWIAPTQWSWPRHFMDTLKHVQSWIRACTGKFNNKKIVTEMNAHIPG